MYYADTARNTGRSTRPHAVAADRLGDAQLGEFLRASMSREEREALERWEASARAASGRTREEREADQRESLRLNLDQLADWCHVRPHAARWEPLTLEQRAAFLAHMMAADMRACSKQVARTIAGQAADGDLAGAVRGLLRVQRAARGW